MRICGVELKSNEAILVLIEAEPDGIELLEAGPRKLVLENDEDALQVRSFLETFRHYVREHRIDKMVIKKRGKRGKFAGGAVTFKMEGMLQLIEECNVELLPPQAISAWQRKNKGGLPPHLKKYQEQAYYTACTLIKIR